ncbi:MAG: hypothetical protein OXF02_07540 [Simkaniaceae bacterium]|nr:hypothetical protein [Simkaniaceae bacterium]
MVQYRGRENNREGFALRGGEAVTLLKEKRRGLPPPSHITGGGRDPGTL